MVNALIIGNCTIQLLWMHRLGSVWGEWAYCQDTLLPGIIPLTFRCYSVQPMIPIRSQTTFLSLSFFLSPSPLTLVYSVSRAPVLSTQALQMSYLPPGWTLERLQTATVDDLRQIPEEVSNAKKHLVIYLDKDPNYLDHLETP